jgi:hypothetical protein
MLWVSSEWYLLLEKIHHASTRCSGGSILVWMIPTARQCEPCHMNSLIPSPTTWPRRDRVISHRNRFGINLNTQNDRIRIFVIEMKDHEIKIVEHYPSRKSDGDIQVSLDKKYCKMLKDDLLAAMDRDLALLVNTRVNLRSPQSSLRSAKYPWSSIQKQYFLSKKSTKNILTGSREEWSYRLGYEFILNKHTYNEHIIKGLK